MSTGKIDVISFYFYPVTGGLETHVLEVFSIFAERGWDITVHASANTFEKANFLPKENFVRGMKVKRYTSHFFGYWPAIDWSNADVISLQNFNIFPHGLLLIRKAFANSSREKKIRIFVSPHMGLLPEWPRFGKIGGTVKKYYNKFLGVPLINLFSDGVHAVSEYERNAIIKTGVEPSLVTVINNGLEKSAFGISSPAGALVVKLTESLQPYIVQVARILPIKNQLTTIEALKFVNKKINLIFAGPVQDEVYYHKLLSRIKELGLENRVKFLGSVGGSDKYFLMKKAVAGVLMSYEEAYSIVALELMSQGTISIFSNHQSLVEISNNGERGFLVSIEDYKELAKKINYIFENNESKIFDGMRAKSFEYAKNKTWDFTVELLINYFNKNIRHAN